MKASITKVTNVKGGLEFRVAFVHETEAEKAETTPTTYTRQHMSRTDKEFTVLDSFGNRVDPRQCCHRDFRAWQQIVNY